MFSRKSPEWRSDSLGHASLDSCHTGWGPLQTVDETAFANIRKAWKSKMPKIAFIPINLSILEMCFTKKQLI